jgi:hypothetical protein
MKTLTTLAASAVAVAVVGAGPVSEVVPVADTPAAQFDHEKHAPLLPDCTSCHANVGGNVAVYPDPTFCAVCHDGSVQPRVDYTPSPTNPRYVHDPDVAADRCVTCHELDGPVQRAVRPVSHDGAWESIHGREAAADPETCVTCHVREDCLDCHRSGSASPAGGYHETDFLSLHPASAYSRETSCADCHNNGAFCQTCHLGAGLVTDGPTAKPFHDGTGVFVAGHGQAARQSLESCVSCHVETDCVRCHVSINPHGPTFNAEQQRKSSPSVCVVCHG